MTKTEDTRACPHGVAVGMVQEWDRNLKAMYLARGANFMRDRRSVIDEAVRRRIGRDPDGTWFIRLGEPPCDISVHDTSLGLSWPANAILFREVRSEFSRIMRERRSVPDAIPIGVAIRATKQAEVYPGFPKAGTSGMVTSRGRTVIDGHRYYFCEFEGMNRNDMGGRHTVQCRDDMIEVASV